MGSGSSQAELGRQLAHMHLATPTVSLLARSWHLAVLVCVPGSARLLLICPERYWVAADVCITDRCSTALANVMFLLLGPTTTSTTQA
jgi:hypothetical protein